MHFPRLTTHEIAETIVYGLFCASVVIFPGGLQAVPELFFSKADAAMITIFAVGLLVFLYVVSTAVMIYRAYNRPV